jgi:hypothetical protein
MTNANVEQVVSAVDGQTLTLKYKDGEKKKSLSLPTRPLLFTCRGTRAILSREQKSSSSRPNKPMDR